MSGVSTQTTRLAAWLGGLVMHRYFLPVCFAVFLALRLAILFGLPVTPTSDAAWYVARGLEIAVGQGYHQGSYPTAFWPIGYPLFLGGVFALAGPHIIAAKLANLTLSCGIFFLTLRLGRRIFACEKTARLGVLLLTVYPNQMAYTGVLFSEMLATFLLLAGCEVFLSRPDWRRALPAGLLFGYAALVKAQFLVMPAILLGLVFWGCWRSGRALRQTLAAGLVFGLAMAVVVGPLTLRNYLVFHQFVPISTNGGLTFLDGNNPEAHGGDAAQNSLRAQLHVSVADQVADDTRAYALGERWIANHPGRFVMLLPLKVWHLWAPDGEGEWWFESGYPGYNAHVLAFRAARVLNQAFYAAMMLAAGYGFLLLWQRPPPGRLWLIGAGFTAVVTLISMAFSGQTRYHFPVMPFIALYAGWAITRLGDRHPAEQTSLAEAGGSTAEFDRVA